MSKKKLEDLVLETALLIAEIDRHPDYQELKEKGYEADAEVGDAYQAMVDLNYTICPPKREKA